jgi:hypothetical protein
MGIYFFLNILFIMQNTFSQHSIYQAKAGSIYCNKLVQGNMEAIARSATKILFNYRIQANKFQSTKLSFKFSINGKGNEMLPGTDHHFILQNGVS